jgi:hypothetical protein
MLSIEVKNILNLKNKRITFGIDDYNLMLELEDILLKQGYYWRGENSKYHYLNKRKYIKIVLYTNFSLNKQFEIMMNSTPYDNEFNSSDIIITRETLNLIKDVFNPKPNYLPRKINREI